MSGSREKKQRRMIRRQLEAQQAQVFNVMCTKPFKQRVGPALAMLFGYVKTQPKELRTLVALHLLVWVLFPCDIYLAAAGRPGWALLCHLLKWPWLAMTLPWYRKRAALINRKAVH